MSARCGVVRFGVIIGLAGLVIWLTGCSGRTVASSAGDQAAGPARTQVVQPSLPPESPPQAPVAEAPAAVEAPPPAMEASAPPPEPVAPAEAPSAAEPPVAATAEPAPALTPEATAQAPSSPAEEVRETVPPPPGPPPAEAPPATVKPAPVPSPPTRALEAALADVYFDFDRFVIRAEAKEVLESNARWLKGRNGVSLVLEGHCDERGTADYNLVLGERRAQSVKKYLGDLGVPVSNLRVVSYGKERPFCTEHSDACWQQNRRVHFVAQ